MKVDFDLLTTVEQGGCSAKLPPALLDKIVIPTPKHAQLLVGTDTHDDAAVWQLSETQALIQTTDFFPPLCSDPYDFGQIAATNALSDVFAMGGEAFMAMNLVMFPAHLDLKILEAILAGGADKIQEVGAVLAGGHTIADATPKYGLAVAGFVHPQQITTNAGIKPGDLLILTKPLGTGIMMAGKKIGEAQEVHYQAALNSMKLTNRQAAQFMRQYQVRGATDITGFGLLGHALKMARASNVTLNLNAACFPLLDGVYQLAELGCLPGACFTNLKYTESACHFSSVIDYNLKMILLDAQTSGGLLIAVNPSQAEKLLADLKSSTYPASAIVGQATPYQDEAHLIIGN